MRQRRSLAFTGTRPQEKECASKPQTVRIRSTIRETTAQQHFDRFGRKRAPAKPALVEVNGLSDFNVRMNQSDTAAWCARSPDRVLADLGKKN